MAKVVNSNLVNQIGDLIKTAKHSDTNLPLKKCDLTHADYTKLGSWTGSGDKNCTDPKILNSLAPVKIEGGYFAFFFLLKYCKYGSYFSKSFFFNFSENILKKQNLNSN